MSDFRLSDGRDPSGYYTSFHGTDCIGFVKWDRSERIWRAWCARARCNELGQSYGRQAAGERVSDHWLIEHFR